MPARKTQLVNGEFYHIIKRGNDKRRIFLDQEDYFRFTNSLLVFNDQNPCQWRVHLVGQREGAPLIAGYKYKSKKPLVEVCAFALMENHFHLLLRQLVDNGIVTYIRKLGGYAYHFNKRHNRTGSLFEGRYKVKLIKTDEQLKNTFVYIHTNPVEIIESRWKDDIVKNAQEAIEFLEKEYRWSSYWDYLGKQNFPFLTNQDFFLGLFKNKKQIKEEIDSWILFKTNQSPRPQSPRPGLG